MEIDEPISDGPGEDAAAVSGGESEAEPISDPRDRSSPSPSSSSSSSSSDEPNEADNGALQPHERPPPIEHSADQSEPSDADDDALQLEARLYFVRGNATKHHRVTRYREAKGGIPLWKDLDRKDSCDLQGTRLFVGDLVQVSTQARDPEAIAQIAEVRDLPDGRHVLRVFWWLKKHQLRGRLSEEDYGMLPNPPLYVKTNHTQVILWDTVDRVRLDVEGKKLCGKIFCYTANGAKLYREDHPQLRWTRVKKARDKE